MSQTKSTALVNAVATAISSNHRVAIIPFDNLGNPANNYLDKFFDPAKTITTVVSLDGEKVEIDLTSSPYEIEADDMVDPTIKKIAVFIGEVGSLDKSVIEDPMTPIPIGSFLATVHEYDTAIDLPENHVFRLKKIRIPLTTITALPSLS